MCIVVLSRALEWRIPEHLHFPDHGLSLFNGKIIRAQSSAEWHHGSKLIDIRWFCMVLLRPLLSSAWQWAFFDCTLFTLKLSFPVHFD